MARDYLMRGGALSAQNVEAVRSWLAASDLIGESPLTGTFMASRGFAITFTRDGLPEVERRFPALHEFIATGVTAEPWRALMSPLERFLTQAVRLYYLNVLVVPAGANVARHVDATLGHLLGEATRTPVAVSVAYIEPGGPLCLWRGEQRLAEIMPSPGNLVCFRGDLGHEVVAAPGGQRVSLVCEQYGASRAQVSRIEPIKVVSHGRFGRVLARKAGE